MKLKFVHKSFMEFFIARIILKEILDDFQFLQWLSYDDFPDSILNFLNALVKTEIKERGEQTVKEIIDKNYSDPKSHPVIKYINKNFFNR